jgi:hypothetical protein
MNRLKLFLVLLLLCFCFNIVFASTQINTPTVSGSWTAAGSPYYVNTDITIPYGTVLVVNPGVEVIFTGYYSVTANGTIKCVGTDKDKIVFKRNDTTGWSNDYVTNGGWAGILTQGNYSNPTADSTMFTYCIFKDAKKKVLNVGANVTLDHCEFVHNRSIDVGSGGYNLVTLGTVGLGRYAILNSSFHDNYATHCIVYSASSDSFFVNNCSFTNNEGGAPFNNAGSKLMFTNNTVSNNQCSGYNAPVQLVGGVATITYNKIFNNTMARTAALSIQSDRATIERNQICNNSQMDALNACGISDGGGGILLYGRDMDNYMPGRSVYIVRNNLIANNYSKLGGGAIATRFATSYIINNTIVNNACENEHAAFFIWGDYSRVRIYNNIIHGNKSNQISLPEYVNFGIIICDSLWLGNNLMDIPFYQAHRYSSINGLKDTITNIIDPVLNLQGPTAGAGLAFDATAADFSLTNASTNCINKGNNAAPYHGDIDYTGNQRIVGNYIDIGAMELSSGNPGTGINGTRAVFAITVFPNPCQNKLFISWDKNEHQPSHMLISDIAGKIVQSVDDKAFQGYMDVSHLANGVYLLKIITSTSKEFTTKFTVNRP